MEVGPDDAAYLALVREVDSLKARVVELEGELEAAASAHRAMYCELAELADLVGEETADTSTPVVEHVRRLVEDRKRLLEGRTTALALLTACGEVLRGAGRVGS